MMMIKNKQEEFESKLRPIHRRKRNNIHTFKFRRASSAGVGVVVAVFG